MQFRFRLRWIYQRLNFDAPSVPTRLYSLPLTLVWIWLLGRLEAALVAKSPQPPPAPPLTFRTYQILLHTNSYFHRLYSYLDILQ